MEWSLKFIKKLKNVKRVSKKYVKMYAYDIFFLYYTNIFNILSFETRARMKNKNKIYIRTNFVV